MNRIDSGLPTPGFGAATAHADASAAQQQAGLMLGEKTVTLAGEVSLADGAEELSLHMAEKTEDKHHAERKVKADRPPQLLDAQEIVEFLDDTHDPDAQEKLIELTKKLLSGQASPRQGAAQAFGDVSQQYLGLQYALREGERQGADPAALEAIRDALADLEIERGPEIRAGLNALRSAGEFAADPAGVARFQQTYRDVVLGETSLAKTLGLALERFGEADLSRGLKQLIAALGHDLAAARPSTDTGRLQVLVSDLYHLEVAVTVLDGCAELGERLAARHGAALDSPRLMRDLIGITGERWVSEARFTALANQQNVTAPEARVTFMAGVRAMLKDLPVQIYPDADVRHSLLNAAQEALDVAIDEEEA
ncbi:SepL/TyeA/HrpJ family type III secretion system gatekeeper [Bordetella genomosp. 1]|uniref:SepL/TyeA/HrpJ family type III secretion system gatekeeper n=1 Tax=Bordetella genomosp. 1 TaxID=1395607 RepID=A0A261S8I2_9BORD|nr:type III secretion system gatekeeper subunit SctW [Bordetella genomosp. 1]OZI33090.1 SepL/TyeA/HrpJ family type III secretion system gatekeeper [Bordetella genomosp. 1]